MNHEFTFDCESFGLKLGMVSCHKARDESSCWIFGPIIRNFSVTVPLNYAVSCFCNSIALSLRQNYTPPNPPLHNASKPNIYPNKSWRFLDGRVVIVSAQRVLESQIFTVSFHCINLPFAVQDFLSFLLLFMFLAADWTVLFLFSG